jgi:XRE family transcriptional regulator, aerobic/anaerobic benzoate catabolism transcriptional regulator
MSSTILHKTEFLTALGERARALRARRGLTRKSLATAAEVSERHLANLEYGTGNASILILLQVANALQCSLSELLGDMTTSNPEWLMIREQLAHADEAAIKRVRLGIGEMLGVAAGHTRSQRIALIGLRGAGKSTLGRRLADDMDYPFVELNRDIEKLAGCSVNEIQALYGMNAYRRYERRALEMLIQSHPKAIIATPGGMVSDAATFNLLLSSCTTVWLKAEPEDHMQRVIAQGDMRPMAASKEAMDDLKQILKGRAAFYSKADVTIDTSSQGIDATLALLSMQVAKIVPQKLDSANIMQYDALKS